MSSEFEKFKKSLGITSPNPLYGASDLEATWSAGFNKAIDEAVKAIKNQSTYHPSAGDFSNNLKDDMVKKDRTIEAVSQLKK